MEPLEPPSSVQSAVGTATFMVAAVTLFVQNSKGQSFAALVFSPWRAAETLDASVYGDRTQWIAKADAALASYK